MSSSTPIPARSRTSGSSAAPSVPAGAANIGQPSTFEQRRSEDDADENLAEHGRLMNPRGERAGQLARRRSQSRAAAESAVSGSGRPPNRLWRKSERARAGGLDPARAAPPPRPAGCGRFALTEPAATTAPTNQRLQRRLGAEAWRVGRDMHPTERRARPQHEVRIRERAHLGNVEAVELDSADTRLPMTASTILKKTKNTGTPTRCR